MPSSGDAIHSHLTVGLKRPRAIVLVSAMLALAACDTPVGLSERTPTPADQVNDPVRQALASSATLDDANRAIEAKDYDRAYSLLRQYLIGNPTDDNAKMSLAQTYLGRREGRHARTVLETLSDDAKELPRAHLLDGLALLIIGQREEATAQLELALEQDASLWQAANGLGLIHDIAKRWDDAEASYNRALDAKPDSAVVHNNLGYSYLLQGRVEEATRSFTTSLSHDPKLQIARSNLRLALAADGRYTDAVAGTDRTDLPRVLNNIGVVAMMSGDFQSADVFFNRAIDESPVYYDTAEENLARLRSLVDKPEGERRITTIGRSLGN